MQLSYDFAAPGRIVFGWGRRREAGVLRRELGRRAFVVSGSRTLEANGALDELLTGLRSAGVETIRLATISHEPLVSDVDEASGLLHEAGMRQDDFVLTVGGGSAIDLAKAVAAMATNRQSPTVQDYLEGVGRGLKIAQPPLPLMALPTTGGTGSEATKNAVISCYDPPFKKSLRSPLMVPRIVLVDPELTVGVPPTTTAWTGMDAVTQLIESYVSRFARPLPRALLLSALGGALEALPRAVADGADRPAREAMAHAALVSGMALANSGLGLAHGVAAALGVHAKVTHGLACAVMLPVALRVNRPHCEQQLAELARSALTGAWRSDAEAADAFVAAIEALAARLSVPQRLSELGVRREQIPELAAGSRGNSMNGNPVQLSDDELEELLVSIL